MMKYNACSTLVSIIISVGLVLFSSISFAGAQSCGDIIFYTEEYDEEDNLVYIEEREPIADCNNPFNADEPAPFAHSLIINNQTVSSGETITIDSTAPVVGEFTIAKPPGVDSFNVAWPHFVLYHATGSDYREVLRVNSAVNISVDYLEPGSYTAVFLFEEPPILGVAPTWWELFVSTLFGQPAFAFYPNYVYVATTSFTIEHAPLNPTGASSVVFLPGIKASRLYMDESGSENQLWNPGGDDDVLKLSMDSNGQSINDVYTDDVLASVGPFNFYKDFLNELKKLRDDEKAIKEYLPFAYDWRYSVFDVATMDIPYPNGEFKNLKDEVLRLADESYTGKVTLIGHSNGGLVAKALLHEYGSNELAGKVDKIIMIGTPQLGTPQAIGTLLHGYKEELGFGFISSAAVVRDSIQNMPGAYGLLPSSRYYEVTGNEPVVTSDDSFITSPFQLYGQITSTDKLKNFLIDSLSAFPEATTTAEPSPLNLNILENSQYNQDILDNWTAPEGVEVFEVVGTGLATIKRFEYRGIGCSQVTVGCPVQQELKLYPIATYFGDEVVIGSSSSGYEGDKYTFYIDLKTVSAGLARNIDHADLTETNQVQEFVLSAIKYQYLTDTLLGGSDSAISKRYTIAATHSPVSIRAISPQGRVGKFGDQILEEVVGSQYFTLGDSTYLILPSEVAYDMEIVGEDNGAFALTIDQLQENDTTQALSYVPYATTTNTMVATFTLDDKNVSEINIDYENDGVIDVVQSPNGEVIAPEPPVETSYSYGDLEREVRGLNIKKAFKAILLAQVKIAQRFNERGGKAFMLLETKTLNAISKLVKSYNKKKLITDEEYERVGDIIRNLIIQNENNKQ